MIKAVLFDIDGTLTDGVSWLKVTELLGASVAEHERIFRDFLKDRLTYTESKRQLIALWQVTGNANQKFLTDSFNNWNLKDDAQMLVDYCDERHYTTALITGSVDLFAQQIARKLSIRKWYANTRLVWDDKGNLIDFEYERDQASKKLEQFHSFLEETAVKSEECIIVGDGNNDIKLFEVTRRGIAVASKDADLLSLSWRQADSLSQVKDILDMATEKMSI